MKTNTVTKAAAPAILLIAWLLFPQTAHGFYNPSTGRWLSRDPLSEEAASRDLGVKHGSSVRTRNKASRLKLDSQLSTPYAFCRNAPVVLVDPWGLLGCTADIVSGHYRGLLTTDASGNISRRDIVYVGCGANLLNERWSQISGYPENNFHGNWADWPEPNANAPSHGPGYPALQDTDYIYGDDEPSMIDKAKAAIKDAICRRDCCAGLPLRISIACQPLSQDEINAGITLHPDCNKTITLECGGTP